MEAPLIGASEAGVRTAGVKIHLERDQSNHEQGISSALDPNNVAVCKYFGPRKIGLVDAAMRQTENDKTAIIVTPGGFGTLDEFFEFVTLKQLKKLGTEYPVPIIVMNYDGFYDKLVAFLAERCIKDETINDYELSLFHVAGSNEEALEILAAEYNIPEQDRCYMERIRSRKKS